MDLVVKPSRYTLLLKGDAQYNLYYLSVTFAQIFDLYAGVKKNVKF